MASTRRSLRGSGTALLQILLILTLTVTARASRIHRNLHDDIIVATIRHNKRDAATARSPTHQNPQIAPPIPIVQLSTDFIEAATENSSAPLRRSTGNYASSILHKRDAERCSVGTPCPDGRFVNPRNTSSSDFY